MNSMLVPYKVVDKLVFVNDKNQSLVYNWTRICTGDHIVIPTNFDLVHSFTDQNIAKECRCIETITNQVEPATFTTSPIDIIYTTSSVTIEQPTNSSVDTRPTTEHSTNFLVLSVSLSIILIITFGITVIIPVSLFTCYRQKQVSHTADRLLSAEASELQNVPLSSRSPTCIPDRHLGTSSDEATIQAVNGLQSCTDQSASFDEAKKKFLDHQILDCDYNGQEYTNVDHDITLRIPEGAVAEGEKIRLEVGVAMYGPFNFPENTKLISPILWLCLLKEDTKLRKPLEIVLPHYLTGNVNMYGIGFMKANHNDYEMKDDCKMFYNFKALNSDMVLVFRENQGYGITVIDHFCYFCLTAKESASKITENTNYCLARVESRISESLKEIIFCASYHLPTCIKAIKEQYKDQPNTNIQFSTPFQFNDPQGSLKITVERSTDQYLIAMEPSDAEIRASKIVFSSMSLDDVKLMHENKTYPPRVKMSVHKKNSDVFKIPVKIDGCTGDGQLNIELLFTKEGLSPLSPTANSSVESAHNLQVFSNSSLSWKTQSHLVRCHGDKPEVAEAFKLLLPISKEWENIGTLLKIPVGTLNNISVDKSDMHSRLRATLIEWLKQVNPPPTWAQLADAVDPFDQPKAGELRTRYVDLTDS